MRRAKFLVRVSIPREEDERTQCMPERTMRRRQIERDPYTVAAATERVPRPNPFYRTLDGRLPSIIAAVGRSRARWRAPNVVVYIKRAYRGLPSTPRYPGETVARRCARARVRACVRVHACVCVCACVFIQRDAISRNSYARSGDLQHLFSEIPHRPPRRGSYAPRYVPPAARGPR